MDETASIHSPLCNAPIISRLLARFEDIYIFASEVLHNNFSEISFPEGRTGLKLLIKIINQSDCLEQLSVFVGPSNFMCI